MTQLVFIIVTLNEIQRYISAVIEMMLPFLLDNTCANYISFETIIYFYL